MTSTPDKENEINEIESEFEQVSMLFTHRLAKLIAEFISEYNADEKNGKPDRRHTIIQPIFYQMMSIGTFIVATRMHGMEKERKENFAKVIKDDFTEILDKNIRLCDEKENSDSPLARFFQKNYKGDPKFN